MRIDDTDFLIVAMSPTAPSTRTNQGARHRDLAENVQEFEEIIRFNRLHPFQTIDYNPHRGRIGRDDSWEQEASPVW